MGCIVLKHYYSVWQQWEVALREDPPSGGESDVLEGHQETFTLDEGKTEIATALVALLHITIDNDLLQL